MRSASRRPGKGQLSLLAGVLDDRDRAVLAFAREHHLQGRVADRVQQVLGMDQTRYYQLLAALIERPGVADAEPELVAGLLALRDRRRQRRWAGSPVPDTVRGQRRAVPGQGR